MNAFKTIAGSKLVVALLALGAILLAIPDDASARGRNHGSGGGKSTGTTTVRDHRTPSKATVRDHRATPKATVRDHRATPKVTDHRKQAQPGRRGGVTVTSKGPRKPFVPQPGYNPVPSGR